MTETTDKTHQDPCADRDLEQAIDAYLLWMKDEGYNPVSYDDHKEILRLFLDFIRGGEFEWDDIFTLDTVKAFQKHSGLSQAHGVRGLSVPAPFCVLTQPEKRANARINIMITFAFFIILPPFYLSIYLYVLIPCRRG